ncbi:hypothetical protein VD0003_g8675 [Verticillium dahliae]|nr:hypothetical protein VD0003_g8675 [Verticillium dahliae]
MGDEPIPATGRSWRASIHGIISPWAAAGTSQRANDRGSWTSCKIMTWEYM